MTHLETAAPSANLRPPRRTATSTHPSGTPHQFRPSAVLRRSGLPSTAVLLSQSSLGWRRRSREWRPRRKPSSPPWGKNWTAPVAAWLGTALTNLRYLMSFCDWDFTRFLCPRCYQLPPKKSFPSKKKFSPKSYIIHLPPAKRNVFYFYGSCAVGWERYCVLNYAERLQLHG